MSFIRPEIATVLHRWREVIGAGALVGLGLWVAARGGPFYAVLGTTLGLAGAGLALMAWRRLRFARQGNGPGVVEVDEGQIAWFGPGIGGFVSLADLAEVGLVTVQGLRVWRFRQADGQLLLVPVAAQGADRLYDALTALPGIDGSRLLAALDLPADTPVLWRRDPLPPNVRLMRP